MSEVKVNKITPTTNCGTVTLGDSGDTIAIPAGVNLTSGGALTNSGTITNTGSITGVAITGTIDNQVNWQTTVKTTGFTAVAGEGYFCNTTSAAFTVTLPASPSAGDLVGIKDYANTADTNNITIGRNGSNIEGVANDFVISVEGGSITLIYVDATKGWLSTAAAKASDITLPTYIVATGGTITTCGDFKIHTFTSPGTFCVSSLSNPSGGPNNVDYLVVAGGGGGANSTGGPGSIGGGAGAGGYRESHCSTTSGCYTASPLATPTSLPVSATAYPITVGAGGTGGGPDNTNSSPNTKGSNSVFSSITSTGGAVGSNSYEFNNPSTTSGGSGSGGSAGQIPSTGGGSGNTPPVSPPQGSNGGSGSPDSGGASAGGGGGATAAGGNGAPGGPCSSGGNGGTGATTLISGSPSSYAGGGGGGSNGSGGGGTGGTGGGGDGTKPTAGSGTTNTGGGGGGSGQPGSGGAGGSGIVIIRYKFQ